MSNSTLVTKTIPAYAGNYSKGRTARGGKISEITVHHTGGITTVDGLGALWQRVGRGGSSHYGVYRAEVGQYVDEADVAWTNGGSNSPHGWEANLRAVTIETCNSAGAPNWPIADDTLDTLTRLVADIAKRNGLVPLVLGENLTWHSMYAATACPGPYLKSKLQYIADTANAINATEGTEEPPPPSNPSNTGLFHVQVGAFAKKANADAFAAKAKAAGFTCFVKPVGEFFKVQLGAFKERANADAYCTIVRAKSFDAFVVGSAEESSAALAVGDKVKVKQGAKDYNGGTLQPFVYITVYVVREINGSRVVIAPKATGAVTAAIDAGNLYRV